MSRISGPHGPRPPEAPPAQSPASPPGVPGGESNRDDKVWPSETGGGRMAASRYPNYDVMAHAGAWDPHTRSIVERRLDPPKKPAFLTPAEAQALRAAVTHLVDEDRDDILGYILSHIDEQLASPVGEAQRKEGVPPQAQLIREGLAALDEMAREREGTPFAECSPEAQAAILSGLQAGSPLQEFFQKLLSLSVEALASHPTIWSEIGYGGPAYPRGYYRIEAGVTDPWEARAEDTDQGS